MATSVKKGTKKLEHNNKEQGRSSVFVSEEDGCVITSSSLTGGLGRV